MSVDQAIKIAKKLMPLLNPERSSNHDLWMEMGWVLYNVGEGCEEALRYVD